MPKKKQRKCPSSDRKAEIRRKLKNLIQNNKRAIGKGKEGQDKISPSPTSPVSALIASNLDYVDDRNDQQAISLEERLTEVPWQQQGLEVPKWKEDRNHYALFFSKAGLPTRRMNSTNPPTVEPTDDASYLKRHKKPEKQEKQRKKWDAQRMRQEQQLQKLRARQEKKSLAKSDLNCQRTSLLPALAEISTICVEKDIPVSIFGRPLPDTGANEFCLPWL